MGLVISALPLYMGSDLSLRRKKGGSRAFPRAQLLAALPCPQLHACNAKVANVIGRGGPCVWGG